VNSSTDNGARQSARTASAPLISWREKVHHTIESRPQVDKITHLTATSAIVVDMGLILYLLVALVLRSTAAGIQLIDSIPLAFYILPLTIVFPSVVKGYYSQRSAAVPAVILIIGSVIVYPLTSLLRGLVVVLVLNLLALAIILFMGRFRPKGSLRSVGKKGAAWLIVLNLLGFMFPVSVYAMGELSIAQVTPSETTDLFVEVPLADFDFPYLPFAANASFANQLETLGYGVNLRVLEPEPDSWDRLAEWLAVLNDTAVPLRVTLSADRELLANNNSDTIGTSQLLDRLFDTHKEGLVHLLDLLDDLGMRSSRAPVVFDMTLSNQEWARMMATMRAIDLSGFSSLLRRSVDSVDVTAVDGRLQSLLDDAKSENLMVGFRIESFVLDDMADSDATVMQTCGLTLEGLRRADLIEVSVCRSRFSLEMNGDVGEYLVHSFSSTLGVASNLGRNYSLLVGTGGNVTDVMARTNPVYTTLQSLVTDIAIASGNGVQTVVISSLQTLLSSYGADVLSHLRTTDTQPVSYTFRIYAFRAVFIAIDSLDVLML